MMKPHEGGTTSGQIDRDFPHEVEIAILGDRLFVMHAFCVSRFMNVRTRSVRTADAEGDAMRWCFADRAHADEFRARFGGKRFVPDLSPNSTMT
jgi:hypothetical protein